MVKTQLQIQGFFPRSDVSINGKKKRKLESDDSTPCPVSSTIKTAAAVNTSPPCKKPITVAADVDRSSPSCHASPTTPTDFFEFQIATDTYHVHASKQPDNTRITSWFSTLNDSLPKVTDTEPRLRAVIGLDCEWCPPWFRDNKPERVNTIQLYSPIANCLILSVGDWKHLPPLLVTLLADESIAKVGVNITGDGSRLARDFDCPVAGLLNLEKGHGGRVTMESLCRQICPAAFHINKDAMESKVRLGNWAAWPLTELQLKYASMDAVISFAIFLFQYTHAWSTRCDFLLPKLCEVSLDSRQPPPPSEKTELVSASANTGKNSNFFLMHQNRSIIPPNLHNKVHPKGIADALHGTVIVISGVLDSMSREEMTDYIISHGGVVKKGITKATTHLVNDHGSVGPSKLKKCEAQGVPIVSEDVIFDLVAKSVSTVID